MNHSTEPNEPDGAPEPGLDARPDLETLPLTETSAEETPPLGVEQVPWGGRDLVEAAYAPLTDRYERLQAGLTGDAVGWTAQIAALRALRTGDVAGDWEILARLLVAPGTLETSDAVRLVRTADEPETVRSLLRDLKAAGERTLLLAPTPEQAAAVLGAVNDDPEIRALLIETVPSSPDKPAEPLTPDVAPQPEPPEAPPRRDSGSHGTVEFKPVTGLPDPGTAATRAEPLPTPEEPTGPDTTQTRALPTLPDEPETPAADAADATRAESLPSIDDEQPSAPPGTAPEPDAASTPSDGAGDVQPNVTPTGRPADEPSARAEGVAAVDTTQTQALPALADEEPGAVAEGVAAANSVEALPVRAGEGHGAQADQAGTGGVSGGAGARGASSGDAEDESEAGEAPAGVAGGRETGSTLPEGLGDEGAPEAWVVGAVLRPVGEGWTSAWRAEGGVLRRGLMWLEQWPRDAEALAAVRAEVAARKEALDAELAGLAGTIEEARDAAQGAEERVVEAEAEAERLVAVEREAEEELAGPRAEAERLQAVADAAGAEAGELTRVADEAFARCTQLDERARTAQEELQGAQQVEASLKDELARAQEALPAAMEEADRLAAVDADASAEGHAAYYRLVSAESALSAVRRKMSLPQRLHVAAPPSQLKSVRAEVRARARDADEAAKRAQEAKDAAERAEAHRQGLAAFVAEGGPRLAEAREAQERLTTELAWLATERETAGAEHREQARRAAESVDRATQAGLEARVAQQAARVIEERAEAARTAREGALAAAERARSDAEAAVARAAEARGELDRRSAEGEAEAAAGEVELRSAAEAEARARENVREVCGADPAGDPDVIGERQRLVMARVEELGGLLQGGEADGSALLPDADVVAGTPVGVGAAVPGERFGALVAVGAVDDADFLVGAVRAARWVLVGPAEDGEPGRGTFARCAVAAPRLVEDGR
ncbi:hypothetical protein [Actinomadura violacea]|uniref:Uncharacterized protein n=1 Tax=Actinomadura violacea TaxID=2819934 RepID=A0ABS3SC84_9ACTN|nr:hypothetical protein [Actinomadura violacea]MBO2466178.1 hypothetical protein [Actinomadura violacea]